MTSRRIAQALNPAERAPNHPTTDYAGKPSRKSANPSQLSLRLCALSAGLAVYSAVFPPPLRSFGWVGAWVILYACHLATTRQLSHNPTPEDGGRRYRRFPSGCGAAARLAPSGHLARPGSRLSTPVRGAPCVLVFGGRSMPAKTMPAFNMLSAA